MKLNQYEQYLIDSANEIVKLLVKNGSSVEDVQDIAQESIIKLLEIDNIIPPKKIRSWLYKVSLNKFYNLYNRNKRYQDIINRHFRSTFDVEVVKEDYSILYETFRKGSQSIINEI